MEQRLDRTMEQRLDRTNLDVTKSYEKVHTIGGRQVYTFVGKFVRAYRMGSGDGMTSHWEFNNNGVTVRVDDETWGSVSGNELLGFRVSENNKSPR